jgi:hypothetical protein
MWKQAAVAYLRPISTRGKRKARYDHTTLCYRARSNRQYVGSKSQIDRRA